MTSVRATKIGIPTLREKARQRKKNVAKESVCVLLNDTMYKRCMYKTNVKYASGSL